MIYTEIHAYYRYAPIFEQLALHFKDKSNVRQVYTTWDKSRTKEYEGRKLVGYVHII